MHSVLNNVSQMRAPQQEMRMNSLSVTGLYTIRPVNVIAIQSM